VTGTQDGNWGLSIVGGSNQVNASSGTIAGTANTVDNMTRGTVAGYQNSVTNAADAEMLGNGNTVSGDRTVTVGNGNTNTAADGVVVGNGNTNEVQGGVVVGNGAGLGADATNSVALGNGSYTNRADTVDVGGRTISNVAPGVLPNDAVNLAQMQAGDARTLYSANAYTDQVFSRVDGRINSAGAAASALGVMAGTAAGNSLAGRNRIAVGTAVYNGKPAIALGYQRTLSDRMNATVGVSFSGGQRVVGAAISYGW
jgi:autotransporter adhesin